MTAEETASARARRSRLWALARRSWYRSLEEVSPAAFCAWHGRFPERRVVGPDTDLVIEGYPAAGNSMVREVLYRTQPGIQLASHVHSGAHVRRALDLGVPTLVLLRPPVESVASLMARYPERNLDPDRELASYQRFYSAVAKVSEQVALARFDDTVSAVNSVIQNVNRHLGTAFLAFDDSEALFEQVFATLDYWSQKVSGSRFEVVTPRPSPARQEALAAARTLVQGASVRRLSRCQELHDQLAETAQARQELFSACRAPKPDMAGPIPGQTGICSA